MSAARQPVLLNLGCGRRRHPAWTNADLVPATPEVLRVDLREPLPFGNGEFDGVYASHVLEHLSPARGRRLVAEIRRILKPGGTVRLVVPDLEALCRRYLLELERAARGEAGANERHAWMTIELIDQMTRVRSGGLMLRWWRRDPVPAEDLVVERLGAEARDGLAWVRRRRAEAGAEGREKALDAKTWLEESEPSAEEQTAFRMTGEAHRWMYDRVSLSQLLQGEGFAEPAVRTAHESRIEGWGEYLLDADAQGRPHKPDSLFVEAIA
ncbi:MAG: methyltransferase domain-containing protein [Phycisphaerae bacterium]|jgi:predicted SAM-dependent methyltransferase|nr:methyltransferase domain-containing protein [Phycisphaerae bacterium]